MKLNTNKTTLFIFLFLIIISLIIGLFFINKINISTSEKDELKDIQNISTYDNPIIPKNFKKIETETASWELDENNKPKGWNDGLVIEDENGNQFVWIPVNEEKLTYNNELPNTITNDTLPIGIDDEYTQIKKRGGFYISRYEIGLPEVSQKDKITIDVSNNNVEKIPISKKDSIPCNYINYKTAKINAENMIHFENIQSGLPTINQWYAILNWLEQAGFDTKYDSKNWGNYSNVNFEFSGYYSIDNGISYIHSNKNVKQTYNMILSTGASERNCANNLYDIAGNLSEWLNAYYSTSPYNNIYCGGHYDNISKYNASYLLGFSGPSDKIGYRVVLYIK